METTPREALQAPPTTHAGIPAGPEAGIYPTGDRPMEQAEQSMQPSIDTPEIQDRARHLSDAAKNSASMLYHEAGSKIRDIQANPESTKKTKIITASTVGIAAIGFLARKRQQSKSMPDNLIGKVSSKAKDLTHSR